MPSTGGRESHPTTGVFVIMGFEWQRGLISELKHCGDFDQSNNMSIGTESEGKCYFVPTPTLLFLNVRHAMRS